MALARRLTRRWSRRDTLLLLVGLAVLAGAGLPLPGYSIGPGRTTNAADHVVVRGREVFRPEGQFLVSTIALRPLSPFLAVRAWLDDDIRTVPRQRVEGSRSRAASTDESKAVAISVALTRLGFSVERTGGGARVESVEPGSPADGRLAPDEVITSVDGRPVSSSGDVTTAIRAKEAGTVLRIGVEGRGGDRTEDIRLEARPGTAQPFLGVSLRTTAGRFRLPLDVSIDAGPVEGESAGLAFTLGVLDVLTPGELTGGARVAVTGTMEVDGRVGQVGSVTEKAVAARRSEARYFLVPEGQVGQAVSGGGGALRVIAVSTLDDALAAIEVMGGDVSTLGPGARGQQ